MSRENAAPTDLDSFLAQQAAQQGPAPQLEDPSDSSDEAPVQSSDTSILGSAQGSSALPPGESSVLDELAAYAKAHAFSGQGYSQGGNGGHTETVYKRDSHGNYIYQKDAHGQYVYQKDEHGHLLKDTRGHYIRLRETTTHYVPNHDAAEYKKYSTQGGGWNAAGASEDRAKAILEFCNLYHLDYRDMCSIIGRETAGSGSPDQWGGYGGRFLGLIQFSPECQAHYGVHPGMSFREQLFGPVAAYLKDRFAAAHMQLEGADMVHIYASILAGSPKLVNAADCNGSAASAVADLENHGRALAKKIGLDFDHPDLYKQDTAHVIAQAPETAKNPPYTVALKAADPAVSPKTTPSTTAAPVVAAKAPAAAPAPTAAA